MKYILIALPLILLVGCSKPTEQTKPVEEVKVAPAAPVIEEKKADSTPAAPEVKEAKKDGPIKPKILRPEELKAREEAKKQNQ
jgi:PBP1b-binding outer membrane lipoprotein LpoB